METLWRDKQQFEDLYKSKNIKVHDLNIKNQERLSNKQKTEYEEIITAMNKSITDLEHSMTELKQKLNSHTLSILRILNTASSYVSQTIFTQTIS